MTIRRWPFTKEMSIYHDKKRCPSLTFYRMPGISNNVGSKNVVLVGRHNQNANGPECYTVYYSALIGALKKVNVISYLDSGSELTLRNDNDWLKIFKLVSLKISIKIKQELHLFSIIISVYDLVSKQRKLLYLKKNVFTPASFGIGIVSHDWL